MASQQSDENLREAIVVLTQQAKVWQRSSMLSLALLAVVVGAAFWQDQGKARFAEIDVERINVLEPDGTLKLVIANSRRAPDQVTDGKSRPRSESNKSPGITFFNDTGDEAGGLKVSGGLKDGKRNARGHLLFDQYRGDQTLGLVYDENDQGRRAGVTVWDRPDTPLGELIERVAAVQAMRPGAERDALQQALNAADARGEFGVTRVFVGKNRNRDATLMLADAAGHARIVLVVPATGQPRIDFLDEDGKLTSSLPAK